MSIKRDNGQGMFTMDFISRCQGLPFSQALQAAREIVDTSTATDANKQKAHAMINKARTTNALLFGMVNFSLSHQGLGVR